MLMMMTMRRSMSKRRTSSRCNERLLHRSCRHYLELQTLAAARAHHAAVRMVQGRRARQRNSMRPLILPVGQRCGISRLDVPTVRMQIKTAIVHRYLPRFTAEEYVVTHREQAPQSRRTVLYTLEAEDDTIADSSQVPIRINNPFVHLSLVIRHFDRRWIEPLPAGDSIPTLARRFPEYRFEAPSACQLPFVHRLRNTMMTMTGAATMTLIPP